MHSVPSLAGFKSAAPRSMGAIEQVSQAVRKPGSTDSPSHLQGPAPRPWPSLPIEPSDAMACQAV